MTVTAKKERVYKKNSVVLLEENGVGEAGVEMREDVTAEVVQLTAAYAIIEVKCACGRSIQVFCDYGGQK